MIWFKHLKEDSSNRKDMSSGMPTRKERKKAPIKTVFSHVMKAKLFGVLTVNALEGIIHEIDEVLPPDTLEGTI